MAIACPHCNASALAVNAFCTACGKAMPDPLRPRPRVVDEKAFAASGAGRVLQAESLDRQARSAGRIMAWLGGIHLLVAVIALGIGLLALSASATDPRAQQSAPLLIGMGVVVGIIAVVFIGLSFWARSAPLPAAITGLVIYVTLTVLDLLIAIDSEPEGFSGRGLVIRFVVIGCLAKAVSAGVKHRALLRESAAA